MARARRDTWWAVLPADSMRSSPTDPSRHEPASRFGHLDVRRETRGLAVETNPPRSYARSASTGRTARDYPRIATARLTQVHEARRGPTVPGDGRTRPEPTRTCSAPSDAPAMAESPSPTYGPGRALLPVTTSRRVPARLAGNVAGRAAAPRPTATKARRADADDDPDCAMHSTRAAVSRQPARPLRRSSVGQPRNDGPFGDRLRSGSAQLRRPDPSPWVRAVLVCTGHASGPSAV